MSHVVSSSAPIASAHTVKQYAGFGILGSDIPTTGDNGGSPVLNDSINPTSEYHWRVETPPSAGVLTIYPDLTFEWDATGVPDGSYPWAYRLFENGTDDGTATVSQTVGSGGISADLAATESGDTLAAQASVALSAALDAAEAGDTVVSSVGISITCSASLSEDGDTLTATASIISDSNTITAASMIRLAEIWARMELDAANPLVTSATQLTVGTIAQDISTGGAVRTGSALVPTIDPDTMIAEVWQRLGLDPDNALTQTNASIDVGNIHLTVSGTDTLTVQRV